MTRPSAYVAKNTKAHHVVCWLKQGLTSARMMVFLLLTMALITSYQLITWQWQLPIVDLLRPSSSLSIEDMAVQLRLLPTMLVALLSGGLLGVVSILLQQLVKNTLASDTTLSVGSGAQMALLLVTLFLPSLGLYGSFWVAFIGAIVSMGTVFLLAMPSRMNPLVLVLSGLVVNILLSAVASLLLIFYSETAMGVMVWGSGVLTQSSWTVVQRLLIVAAGLAGFVTLLYRPLVLISLDDRQAKSLGVPINGIRLGVTLLAAFVTATIVSDLGGLSFIGLGAATLVNMLALRFLYQRLLVSFVLGGLLLWLTSNITIFLEHRLQFAFPAGALTGLLGAPLIIWLILRQRHQTIDSATPMIVPERKPVNIGRWVVIVTMIASLALFIAPQIQVLTSPVSSLQQSMTIAWGLSDFSDWSLIQQYRLPRTVSAAATGVMLATAGVLLQTLTRNPMASPEVLGVSSGAALGVILGFVLLPSLGITVSMGYLTLSGFITAGWVLGLIIWLSRRVQPSYLLLIGVAISALMGGVLSLIKLSGDPRLQAVLSWLSGTTYATNPNTAWWLTVAAIVLYGCAFVLIKPLQLLSLGRMVAQGRGVATTSTEKALLLLIALLSTASTLAVGPLSFVGLIIPHLAVTMGAATLQKQLPLAAILGAGLMVFADWFGRYVVFPYEIPAGTLAAIVGAGYFIYLMRKLR